MSMHGKNDGCFMKSCNAGCGVIWFLIAIPFIFLIVGTCLPE